MERLAGRVILLWGWRRALAAMAAGAILALAMPPVDFFAAGFVSFTLLAWLLDGEPEHVAGWRRRLFAGFGVGWCFGFGYFVAGLYWVGNALLVEAELFAWALPLAVVGLPTLLALFHGFATALASRLASPGLGRIAALAFAFGLAEWLRSFVLTGFPWNAVGLAAMPVPLAMQSSALVGLFGVTALAVLVFAMPALLAARRHVVPGIALALVLVAAHLGYGAWRLSAEAAPGASLAVRIVQPSIDQAQKWDTASRDAIFARLVTLTDQAPADGDPEPSLVVWPETAFPFLLADRPDALAALADALGPGQSLMAGAVRVEPATQGQPGRFYNSILTFDETGEIVGAFDKAHLVPFGEYVPLAGLLHRIGIGQIASAFPAFSAGTQGRLIATGQEGVGALGFICYEIIFPGYADEGRREASLLVNLTNDAWFGVSAGPYQHFRQAQLRAVEAGLPLVRAANNGISAVVDAHGRLLDGFELDAVGALDVDVPLERVETDPRRAGLFGLALVAALGLLSAALRIRHARSDD